MEQQMRDSESSLRRRIDEGRDRYSGNRDLGLEFVNARLLAARHLLKVVHRALHMTLGCRLCEAHWSAKLRFLKVDLIDP